MSKLSSLRLLESYIEDLSLLVDESERLQILNVSYDHNDYEMRKSLQKITKFLERNDDGENYDELVKQYQTLQNSIKTIDTSEFKYTRNVLPKKLETKKSVRFNDTLEFSEEFPQHKPYKDTVIQEPDEASSNALFHGRTPDLSDDGDVTSIDSSSNQDVFIQHQQQLLDQDTHLDALAQSVRRQHGLSLEINSELEHQNIMLEDLEAQIDSSDRRLNKGQKRLDYFTRKAKENGQWLTIIALIIILVLLLVILK